jgi:hypothetical protein
VLSYNLKEIRRDTMDEKKELAARQAKEEFTREYMRSGPFAGYVNMVGTTFRFLAERPKNASEEELELIKKEIAAKGEDPEEYYIVVGLERRLPQGMNLPNVYKGFKVSVSVIGRIRAL